jgi:hypothetical protein
VKEGWHTGRGIIVLPLTHSNYGLTSWTDFFVDRLLGSIVMLYIITAEMAKTVFYKKVKF